MLLISNKTLGSISIMNTDLSMKKDGLWYASIIMELPYQDNVVIESKGYKLRSSAKGQLTRMSKNIIPLHELPHGSGIDASWYYDVSDNRYDCSYHVMDCMGGYDGWVDFSVKFPSCDVTFNDKEYIMIDEDGDEYDELPSLREYLEDTFYYFWGEYNKEK